MSCQWLKWKLQKYLDSVVLPLSKYLAAERKDSYPNSLHTLMETGKQYVGWKRFSHRKLHILELCSKESPCKMSPKMPVWLSNSGHERVVTANQEGL
jgi:hypothetical protein